MFQRHENYHLGLSTFAVGDGDENFDDDGGGGGNSGVDEYADVVGDADGRDGML